MSHCLRDILNKHSLIVNMQIGTADTGVGYLHQHFVLLAVRSIYFLRPDIMNTIISESLHLTLPFYHLF